jgi:hypothetical protein
MCPAFPQTAEVDPNDVRSFELIPAGWYAAQMVASEAKSAKSGAGEYLNLEFDLLDAPYANRKVWLMLNLWNANPEAVRIANQQRLELLMALNKPNAQTTEELHGIPVMLKLGIREDRSGKYEPQQVIKGFKPYGSATPARAAGGFPAAAPRQAAAPAAAAKKPWEK